jgi:thiamine pyrophosphokinase
LKDGAQEILLLGALGGRLDQTLANLLILAQREWPVPICLAEDNQLAQVLSPQKTLVLEGQVGSTVSIVPLSPAVKGITFSGLAYPLENATLHLGSTRGISNEIASYPATIRVDRGKLLVIQAF